LGLKIISKLHFSKENFFTDSFFILQCSQKNLLFPVRLSGLQKISKDLSMLSELKTCRLTSRKLSILLEDFLHLRHVTEEISFPPKSFCIKLSSLSVLVEVKLLLTVCLYNFADFSRASSV
jgi:hypothetical protein